MVKRLGLLKKAQDTDTQWAYWEGLLKFYKAWHVPGRCLELVSASCFQVA